MKTVVRPGNGDLKLLTMLLEGTGRSKGVVLGVGWSWLAEGGTGTQELEEEPQLATRPPKIRNLP